MPFVLADLSDGKYQLQSEDLAKFGDADYDYDDHYWNVRVLSEETVAGRVWSDDDADGVQDPDEAGMLGETVKLLKDASTEQTAVTDDDGGYSFAVFRDPTAGYAVEFERPEGYEFTEQLAGGDRTLDSDADPATGRTPEVFTSSTPVGAVGGGVIVASQLSR